MARDSFSKNPTHREPPKLRITRPRSYTNGAGQSEVTVSNGRPQVTRLEFLCLLQTITKQKMMSKGVNAKES